MSTSEGLREVQTPEGLAHRLAEWSRYTDRGWALAVTNDLEARARTESLLGSLLSDEGRVFRRVPLQWLERSRDTGEALLAELSRVPYDLASVTGLGAALSGRSRAADGIRVLNTYRERLGSLAGCQVWWLTPTLMEGIRSVAPDLHRWFLLVERLPDRSADDPETPWGMAARFEARAPLLAPENLLVEGAAAFEEAGSRLTPEEFSEVDSRLAVAISHRLGRPGSHVPQLVAEAMAAHPAPAAVLPVVVGLIGQGRAPAAQEFLQSVDLLFTAQNRTDLTRAYGEVYQSIGRPDLAQARFEESLASEGQVLERFAPSVEALRDRSVSLTKIGDALMAQGKPEEAQARFEESLGARDRILEQFGTSPLTLRDRSVSLERIGGALLAQGRPDLAQATFEESLATREQILEQFGTNLRALRDRSVSLEKIGDCLMGQGKPEKARARFEEALAARDQILELYGPGLQALRDRAVSLARIGGALLAKGGPGLAQAKFEESLAEGDQILDQFGPSLQALRDRAASLDGIGESLLAQGRSDLAQAKFEESLATADQILDQFGPSLEALRGRSVSLIKIGDSLVAQGEPKKAQSKFEESLPALNQILDQFGPSLQALRDRSVSLIKLGDSFMDQGRPEEARTKLRESLATLDQILQQFGPSLETLRDLAVAHLRYSGRLTESGRGKKEGWEHMEAALRLYMHLLSQFPHSPQIRGEAAGLGNFLTQHERDALAQGRHPYPDPDQNP